MQPIPDTPPRAEPSEAAPIHAPEKAKEPAEPPRAKEARRERELDRVKREAGEARERYLRTLAEFENTKKRLHREKEEFIRYASETMVRGLLPIVDSLDQALVAVDKQGDPQAIITGIHLIYRQLLGLLEKEGVKRIPTIGEPFDPHRHEAVAQVEAGDGVADESVVEEVQVGYTLHGTVIRPAMVKVAKKTGSSGQRAASSENEGPER